MCPCPKSVVNLDPEWTFSRALNNLCRRFSLSVDSLNRTRTRGGYGTDFSNHVSEIPSCDDILVARAHPVPSHSSVVGQDEEVGRYRTVLGPTQSLLDLR